MKVNYDKKEIVEFGEHIGVDKCKDFYEAVSTCAGDIRFALMWRRDYIEDKMKELDEAYAGDKWTDEMQTIYDSMAEEAENLKKMVFDLDQISGKLFFFHDYDEERENVSVSVS